MGRHDFLSMKLSRFLLFIYLVKIKNEEMNYEICTLCPFFFKP